MIKKLILSTKTSLWNRNTLVIAHKFLIFRLLILHLHLQQTIILIVKLFLTSNPFVFWIIIIILIILIKMIMILKIIIIILIIQLTFRAQPYLL